MAAVDLGAVLLLGAWTERHSRSLLTLTVVTAAMCVAFSVHFSTPAYTHYRGASGIASGLFIVSALALLSRATRPLPRILVFTTLGLFVVKLSWEAITHQTLFAGEMAPGVQTTPLIHLAGAAAGGASFLVWTVALRWRLSGQSPESLPDS